MDGEADSTDPNSSISVWLMSMASLQQAAALKWSGTLDEVVGESGAQTPAAMDAGPTAAAIEASATTAAVPASATPEATGTIASTPESGDVPMAACARTAIRHLARSKAVSDASLEHADHKPPNGPKPHDRLAVEEAAPVVINDAAGGESVYAHVDDTQGAARNIASHDRPAAADADADDRERPTSRRISPWVSEIVTDGAGRGSTGSSGDPHDHGTGARPASTQAADFSVPPQKERAHAESASGRTQSVDIAASAVTTASTWSAHAVQSADVPAQAIPDAGDLRHQIVQAVRLQWQDGTGEAKLTLRPEYLGEVTITLRVEQGGVTAHFAAESSEVRAWMNANEPQLRQALSDQGLVLARLIVSDQVANLGPDGEARRQRPHQQKQRPRPQRTKGTFELVV
jgi:flagellar hook-length control protein FliK